MLHHFIFFKTLFIIAIDLSISLYETINGGANLIVLSEAGTFNNFFFLISQKILILLILVFIPNNSPAPLT